MKKLSIICAFWMLSSCFVVQPGEVKGMLACIGIYGLNLGVIAYKTGDIDLLDIATAITSASLLTNYLQFPPKTIKECKVEMALQVVAGGLMLGRVWYKATHRPVPAAAVVSRQLNAYG
jgi:hypothetical protein